MSAMQRPAPDVHVFTVGLVHTSACAPVSVSRDDVEAAVNASHPTGISSPWRISDEPTFSGGESNPCPCNTDETRQHWLLSC